jgi:hypothetical protein
VLPVGRLRYDRAPAQALEPDRRAGGCPFCAKVVWPAADQAGRQCRDVAQFGSALDWGSRGRGFKSRRPDW